MAEGSEFRSGIRLPDGWDVRAYMGDVSTPARGNLADNHFFLKQLLKLKTVSKFVQSNHKNTKRWNRLQSLSIS